MNQQQVNHICQYFALGTPKLEIQRISGGFLHHMWRLETSRGVYAMKELNTEILHRPGARKNYLLSEKIAHAFAAAGLPVVTALQGKVGCLYDTENTTVMLFNWVEGKSLVASQITPVQAEQIGSLFGKMHALHIQLPELKQSHIKATPTVHWQTFVRETNTGTGNWSTLLQEALPDIITWHEQLVEAIPALDSVMVISHKDLDPKNVLWQNEQTPYLIDWEAAGWINPTLEIVRAALDWSGLQRGTVHSEIFRTMITSYVQAGGVLHVKGKDALMGTTASWLNWLRYNIRRATGELATNEEEQQTGRDEVNNTLRILYLIAKQRDTWARWLDQYMGRES